MELTSIQMPRLRIHRKRLRNRKAVLDCHRICKAWDIFSETDDLFGSEDLFAATPHGLSGQSGLLPSIPSSQSNPFQRLTGSDASTASYVPEPIGSGVPPTPADGRGFDLSDVQSPGVLISSVSSPPVEAAVVGGTGPTINVGNVTMSEIEGGYALPVQFTNHYITVGDELVPPATLSLGYALVPEPVSTATLGVDFDFTNGDVQIDVSSGYGEISVYHLRRRSE